MTCRIISMFPKNGKFRSPTFSSGTFSSSMAAIFEYASIRFPYITTLATVLTFSDIDDLISHFEPLLLQSTDLYQITSWLNGRIKSKN